LSPGGQRRGTAHQLQPQLRQRRRDACRLALRRALRARSGAAGADDREPPLGAAVGPDARMPGHRHRAAARRLPARLAAGERMMKTIRTMRPLPRETPSVALLPDDPFDGELVAQVRPPEWINPPPARRYNLVVIGGGTAGLV